MSTRVVDRVDEWSERSFADGYRSLHEFADEGFSGVVRAGGAELFMTKGSVVGVRRGSIEDFADATGTAYESPSPALPLLAIMQATNDEVRAEYYSEQTSISEVDSTLSDGGFTGFVELSDNVLSGDYYMVYHAGRSMSVGFVGSSSRLVDGDEAFETANDEVGIYQVRPADIEVVEIPDVETATGGATDESDDTETEDEKAGDTQTDTTETADAAAEDDTAAVEEATDTTGAAATTEDATAADVTDTTDDPDDEPGVDDQPEPAGGDDADQQGRSGGATARTADTDEAVASTPGAGRESADEGTGRTEHAAAGTPRESVETDATDERATDARTADAEGATTTEQTPAEQTATEQTTAEQATTKQRSAQEVASSARENASASAVNADRQREQPRPGEETQESQPQRFRESEEAAGSTSTPEPEVDLETRAIPSLDPERTSDPDDSGGSARADTFGRAQEQRSPSTQSTQSKETQRTEPPTQQEPTRTETNEPSAQETSTQAAEESAGESETDASDERVEELQAEIADRDEEIARLESELSRKTTEYEDAKSQLEAVREERDALETEIKQLESELDRLETQFGAATDAERRMTPAEALSGTDIFPRYESKGDATLKKAHDGSHRRDDVLDNLRLEKNTQFDAGGVSVGGQTYDEFLESTLEYRFVNWVVGNLLFEIRETGHKKALKDLYNALPVIDWADLKGTVEVEYTEDGQETRSQESFDIVLRNRMGEPLVVVNVNDSREGATESMMENLVRSAERVGQSSDAFAGAFLVTKSFFEPPALETADAATKGGLLSRDKRKSFVNLSRKNGYHLCLVEARNENFTLLVPEL